MKMKSNILSYAIISTTLTAAAILSVADVAVVDAANFGQLRPGPHVQLNPRVLCKSPSLSSSPSCNGNGSSSSLSTSSTLLSSSPALQLSGGGGGSAALDMDMGMDLDDSDDERLLSFAEESDIMVEIRGGGGGGALATVNGSRHDIQPLRISTYRKGIRQLKNSERREKRMLKRLARMEKRRIRGAERMKRLEEMKEMSDGGGDGDDSLSLSQDKSHRVYAKKLKVRTLTCTFMRCCR